MLLACILEIQTAQNSSLRGKEPTGAERTQDIPQLLKQQNWLKHLCTLSTVKSCFLSPAKGFSKFADAKQKPQTAHPKQAKGTKRHTWHSRNAATNNIPSARCSAKCPNRKFPDLGSTATNGPDIQWKRSFSSLTPQPATFGAGKVASEVLKMDRNASNCTFCVFAETSSNVRISNVSARCCLHGVHKTRKRKEMMQNGGVVA